MSSRSTIKAFLFLFSDTRLCRSPGHHLPTFAEVVIAGHSGVGHTATYGKKLLGTSSKFVHPLISGPECCLRCHRGVLYYNCEARILRKQSGKFWDCVVETLPPTHGGRPVLFQTGQQSARNLKKRVPRPVRWREIPSPGCTNPTQLWHWRVMTFHPIASSTCGTIKTLFSKISATKVRVVNCSQPRNTDED